jgi:hypothetical protein
VFANFVQLIAGRVAAPETGQPAFIQDVRVTQLPVRDPRVVRLLAVGWVLIAVKHVAIIWAVWHYRVPLHQLWINFPTWLLGVLATAVVRPDPPPVNFGVPLSGI